MTARRFTVGGIARPHLLARLDNAQRLATGSPPTGTRRETPGNACTASVASAVRDVPLAKAIPIALDDAGAATGTVGALPFGVVRIPSVDVVQTSPPSPVAGTTQRLGRRRRRVEHLEVGVKGREMQRHVRAEVLDEPVAQATELLVGIVL